MSTVLTFESNRFSFTWTESNSPDWCFTFESISSKDYFILLFTTVSESLIKDGIFADVLVSSLIVSDRDIIALSIFPNAI